MKQPKPPPPLPRSRSPGSAHAITQDPSQHHPRLGYGYQANRLSSLIGGAGPAPLGAAVWQPRSTNLTRVVIDGGAAGASGRD